MAGHGVKIKYMVVMARPRIDSQINQLLRLCFWGTLSKDKTEERRVVEGGNKNKPLGSRDQFSSPTWRRQPPRVLKSFVDE